MTTFAFIFARGGSVGVPRKNVKELLGKPLIAYSIEIAKKISSIERIFVSTDDQEISKVAKDYGAEVIDRPSIISQSDSPEWLAWRHAIEALKEKGMDFDVFLSLPTTSPLREAEDIKACLNSFDDSVDMVLTMAESSRSPWFNMVKEKDGYLSLLIEGGDISRRQDAPKSYDLTTVAYVTRPEYIMSADRIFQGRVKGITIPQERSLDIDTEFDFLIAELILKNSKKTYE